MSEYDKSRLFPDMRLARLLLERLGKNSLSVSVEVAAEKILEAQHALAGKDAEIEKLTADVEALWQTIDDIDTGLDMFKPPLNAFAQYIIRKVKERFKIRSSDGYVLLPPDTSTEVES